VYGADKNTPVMAAHAKGATNDATKRRGLFGGWRKGGNDRLRAGGGGGGDLSGGDDVVVPTTAAAAAPPTASTTHPWSSRDAREDGAYARVLPPHVVDGDAAAPPRARSGKGGIAADVDVRGGGDGAVVLDDDGVEPDGIDGGDVVADRDDEDEDEGEERRMDNRLRPGDHVYVWQAYGINPRAYQRHAVVFSVERRGGGGGDGGPTTNAAGPPADDDAGGDRTAEDSAASFDLDNLYAEDGQDGGAVDVAVVSFYHFNRHHAATGAARARQAASGDSRGKRSGCRRESLLDFVGQDGAARRRPVHKVRYGRAVRRGLLSSRAGVGTALKKDRPGLVLARLRYFLDNPDHLPDHSALSANGECASLWCVTGRWCTLQGASILAVTSVGQAGGALLAGGILSNLTVLVPMPGLWGMAGWWWYVPATVAYPFLVPMLVTMGMASLVPLEILRRNRKRWKGITDGLNHEFWTITSEDVREEYFGMMATAEREAEMRTFFGVREGDANAADDARYMPVGDSPGGPDGDDDGEDEEAEALAMQRMEKSCQDMIAGMDVDLSGRPPPPRGRGGGAKGGGGGAWGSFVGSFRRKESGNIRPDDSLRETERFHMANLS